MLKFDDGKMEPAGIAVNCLIGAVAGLILTLILLFGFAAMISGGSVNVKYSEWVVIISAFIGATVAGVIAAKRQKRSVLPIGALAGAAFFILILLLTALGAHGNIFSSMTIKLAICGVGGGILGGTLCLGRGKKRKTKRPR